MLFFVDTIRNAYIMRIKRGTKQQKRREKMRKVNIDKFHSALDEALAIVIAKREAGYTSTMEKFTGDMLEKTLSSIVTMDEFKALNGDVQNMIFTILYEADQKVMAGMIASIIKGETEVVAE